MSTKVSMSIGLLDFSVQLHLPLFHLKTSLVELRFSIDLRDVRHATLRSLIETPRLWADGGPRDTSHRITSALFASSDTMDVRFALGGVAPLGLCI